MFGALQTLTTALTVCQPSPCIVSLTSQQYWTVDQRAARTVHIVLFSLSTLLRLTYNMVDYLDQAGNDFIWLTRLLRNVLMKVCEI